MKAVLFVAACVVVLSQAEGKLPRPALRKAPRGPPPARLSADAPRETVVAVSAGLIGALQFGYALGVLNAPQAVICESLTISPVRWAALVSAFGPAGLIGAQSAGRMIQQVSASQGC